MTLEVNEPAAQTDAPAAAPEIKQDIESVRNPEAVLAKNRQLKAELDAKRKEAEELAEWKKERELEQEEKKGNFESVINQLREENKALKTEMITDKKTRAFERFESQVKSAAREAGCQSPDKLMRLLTKEQMQMVQLEDGKANSDDLANLIGLLKEEHKDIGLFKDKKVNFNPVNYSATPASNKPLTVAELKDQIRNSGLR
jgi:hypothetical protein